MPSNRRHEGKHLSDEHSDQAVHVLASYLDLPSCYMGGPSPSSRRKAMDALGTLANNGFHLIFEDPDETEK